jgi:hypothetical protein
MELAMSDLSELILSSMHRGSVKRQKKVAAEAKTRKTAEAKGRVVLEREFNKFARKQLPTMCLKSAEAGEERVVVHKIDNADLEAGYDGYNPRENGSDIAFGLLGAAHVAILKLQELRLQPEILWGGEIDYETYGDAYYICIPVPDEVAH